MQGFEFIRKNSKNIFFVAHRHDNGTADINAVSFLFSLKSLYFQGFSLKGTKIDQWVKAGTGQEKTRSSKRWSDFSLYTDENSSEVTTISELFGFF